MTVPPQVSAFEAAVQRAVGWAVVAALVLSLFVATAVPFLYPPWWWLSAAPATVVTTLWVAARCIRGRLGARGRLIFVLATAVASAAAAVALAPSQVGGWTAITPLTGFALMLVGLFDGARPSVLAAVSVLIGADVVLPVLLQGHDLVELPLRVGLGYANFAAGCIGGFAARRLLVAAERDRARLAAALRQDQIATAWMDDRREQERWLHDNVLNTLTAIGSGTLRDTPGVRRRCHEDAELLGALLQRSVPAEPTGDMAGQLGALAASFTELGFPVTVTLDPAPPTNVSVLAGTALLGAAREALNNAQRHSGASGADVRLQVGATTVVVTVRDRGRGLTNASGGRYRGTGLRRSVQERMRNAGGGASVGDASDGGTEVVLTWPC